MNLGFTLSNIVALNGNISIALPSSMTTSIPTSCTSTQVVNGVTTSLTCRPTSDGLIAILQSYTITDTYNLYGQIQVNTVVNGLQNPYTNLPTDPIYLRTYGMYVEDSYLIDAN
jgi:hypothetical protein